MPRNKDQFVTILYNEIIKHFVPVKYNPFKSGQNPLNETVFFRSKPCEIFVNTESHFEIKTKYAQEKKKSLKRKSVASATHARPKAPYPY